MGVSRARPCTVSLGLCKMLYALILLQYVTFDTTFLQTNHVRYLVNYVIDYYLYLCSVLRAWRFFSLQRPPWTIPFSLRC